MSLVPPRLIRADSVILSAEHGAEKSCGDANRVTRLARELQELCDAAGAYDSAFTHESVLQLATYLSPVQRNATGTKKQREGAAQVASGPSAADVAYRSLVDRRPAASRKATVDPKPFGEMFDYLRHSEQNAALRKLAQNFSAFRAATATRRRVAAQSTSALGDEVAKLLARGARNRDLQAYLLCAKALLCRASTSSAGLMTTTLESPDLAAQIEALSKQRVISHDDVRAEILAQDALFAHGKLSLPDLDDTVTGPSGPLCLRCTKCAVRIDETPSLRYESQFLMQSLVRLHDVSSEQIIFQRGRATNGGVRGSQVQAVGCVCLTGFAMCSTAWPSRVAASCSVATWATRFSSGRHSALCERGFGMCLAARVQQTRRCWW